MRDADPDRRERRSTGARMSLVLAALLLAGCAQMPGSGPGGERYAARVAEEVAPLIESGDRDEALARYDASLEDAPDNQILLADRALLALKMDRDVEALAGLRRAVDAAVAQGDTSAARDYGEWIEQIVAQRPAWVGERIDVAEALPDDPEIAAALEFRDSMRSELDRLTRQGDMQGALEVGEQILGLSENYFGPEHALTIESTVELANLSYAAGDPAGAESLLMLALERAFAAYGDGHPRTLDIYAGLADLYEARGRGRDSLSIVREASTQADKALGPTDPRSLDLRMELARRLEAAGEYAEGAQVLEESCAAAEQTYGRWHRRTADCREQYGILLSRGGDIPGARDAFTEVLAVREAVLGDADPAILTTRLDLASLERQDGSHEAALKALSQLRDDVTEALGSEDPLLTDVEELQARVLFDLGRTGAARPLAVKVYEARLAEQGEDAPLTLDALNLIGAIDMRDGDFLAAEEAWTRVLDGYRELYGVEHLATITAMANLGLVLENQGLYDRAEPLLRTAVDSSEKLLGQGHPQTLTSMNNLALLHESQGRFDRAEPLYKLPLEVLRSTLGERHPRTIAVMNNLAYLYMLEERYEQAARMFSETRSAWAEAVGPEHQDTLKSLNNLGRVQRRMGELDAAEQTLSEALDARRRTLGERHPDTLRSMQDLGRVYLDQGRPREAETLLETTLNRAEQTLGPQHPYTFETLNALADALGAQERVREAFELRRTGFERRSRFLDRVLWVTNENAREGYIRLHRDELDAYLGLLPELEDETAGRELLEVSLQRKGLLLKVASEIRQIASLGLDSELVGLTESLEEAREELASLTLSGPNDGDPEAHLARIRELEDQVEELQAELGRASARYRESIANIGVQDLVAFMEDGSTLVDFLVHVRPDGSRALLAGVLNVQADGTPEVHLVEYADMAEVEKAIRDYREIIQEEGALDEDVDYFGNQAWERIWQPVAQYLPEDGPVYVVPDGQLNILPFDALVDADGSYLLETTDLHVLSSSRDLLPSAIPAANGDYMVMAGPDYDTEEVVGPQVLAAARSRRSARSTLAEPEVTAEDDEDAFGPMPTSRGGSRAGRFEEMRSLSLSELDSRASMELATLRAAASGLRGLSFAPLPGAELEGELISERVDEAGNRTAMFTRAEAEEILLSELDTPPRVLHLATHGFFLKPDQELRRRLLKAQRSADIQVPPSGDNPLLRAGLAFAGINSNAPFLGEIDTSNDGVLTALEVLSLDLSGTELAVLSACETGLGQIHDGEGVYGLRRAFQEAGVQEVVVSLWEVSDAGTQALMAAMYERLMQGMPPREALRDAQRELMESPRWGYPFIWSAFMIVGK